MGFASFVTGQILGQNERGELTHFPINGLLSLACVYACIYLARFLKPAPARAKWRWTQRCWRRCERATYNPLSVPSFCARYRAKDHRPEKRYLGST